MVGDPELQRLRDTQDFYSTSECRDLLFHVQECRFKLHQIKKILAERGLRFVGFSPLDPSVSKEYAARFADDPTQSNLDYWGFFELEFPATFTSMYQFWVQKAVDRGSSALASG